MRYSGPGKSLNRHRLHGRGVPSPSEQTDEAPGLIEREQVDVEREIPTEDNEAIERGEPQRPAGPAAVRRLKNSKPLAVSITALGVSDGP